MLSPKASSQPIPASKSHNKNIISNDKSSLAAAAQADDFVYDGSSDEERTHNSVLGRHMRKRRRTNSMYMSSYASSPFTPSSFTLSPPQYDFPISDLPEDDDSNTFHRRRKSSLVPQSDVQARQRCYEYLHTAIDAVWAEFCNSTSYAESQKYMPNSPTSDSEELIADASDWATLKANRRSDSISLQPQTQSLMRQKKRLTNAKDLLAHFVSVPDINASNQFWKTWDLLKYQIVELVEGEGEDDEHDEVIEELEAGRC
ncbi:hypothetical protein DASB73_010470 [Starmerella bacillaris]|uniref:Uncharacterized protein n=1 Tax=Starmerella bacillaris TaxID=1247836 RepID=A0AAV5RHU3_STABA|nr:hypothetical protein DASB73_010470 [Starmerella bacillaris]